MGELQNKVGKGWRGEEQRRQKKGKRREGKERRMKQRREGKRKKERDREGKAKGGRGNGGGIGKRRRGGKGNERTNLLCERSRDWTTLLDKRKAWRMSLQFLVKLIFERERDFMVWLSFSN